MELALSPVMLPVAAGYAMLCHFHRQASRYIPNIVAMDTENATTYSVVPDTKASCPTFHVMDENKVIFYSFQGTRFSKGTLHFFKHNANGEKTLLGTVSVGIWSKFFLAPEVIENTADELTHIALGQTQVKHQSDALDNYRLFELSDNNVYQWSFKGKVLEKVFNLGQKDSEIRERLSKVEVITGGRGYRITLDATKISPSVALMTSMISFLDQWNNMLGIGGIYYPLKKNELPWRRV